MASDLLPRAAGALAGSTRRRVINASRMRPRSVAEIHQVLKTGQGEGAVLQGFLKRP